MQTMEHETEREDRIPPGWAAVGCFTAALLIVLGMWALPGPDAGPAQESGAPSAPALATDSYEANWPVLVRSVIAYDAWLRNNPEPAQLHAFVDPSHPQWDSLRDDQLRLASGEWRYAGEYRAREVADVQVIHVGTTTAAISVGFGPRPGVDVLNASGDVIHSVPALPAERVVQHYRWSGDRWRLLGVEGL